MTFDLNENDLSNISYLIARDSIVVDTGSTFLEMTGYSKDEIQQKYISEVILELLRQNCTVFNLENNSNDKSIFLFTKSNEVREVKEQGWYRKYLFGIAPCC